MKEKITLVLPVVILIASFFLGGYAHAKHKHAPPWARTIKPIVSTDWLEKNLYRKNLVILDIRSADDYAVGHIPNSLNEPFIFPECAWITIRDGLFLEVPDEADLFSTIGSLGIKHDSKVVIVTAPNPGEPPFYGFANATRVALTLIYARVKKVAVLDGGYPKWVEDGLPITEDVPEVKPVTCWGKVNEAMFVPIEYVEENIGEVVILDARDANVYFGVFIEPFADKYGHIPSARSLPAPWIWDINPDDGTYTYKDEGALSKMASRAICGPCGYKGYGGQEIIVYCGVGGYASSWWFVLTEVLGYKKVKVYDGSAQEWVIYNEMVPDRCD